MSSPAADALIGAIVGAVLANTGWWTVEWCRFRREAAREQRRREAER